MGKIHLLEQKSPHVFYVLEEDVDHIGAMHNGLVSIINTDDILQAENISDLLRTIYDSKDGRFYAGTDFIDSKKRTKKETYPLHGELHILPGFIREICDIRTEYLYTSDWTVRYVSELWIRTSEYEMLQVQGFTEKARREAEEYIAREKLLYEKVS